MILFLLRDIFTGRIPFVEYSQESESKKKIRHFLFQSPTQIGLFICTESGLKFQTNNWKRKGMAERASQRKSSRFFQKKENEE